MRRFWTGVALLMLVLLVLNAPVPVMAQGGGQQLRVDPELILSTAYPSQVIGIDENVSIGLKLRTETASQVVHLQMKQIPEDWTATFRGGGKIIQSAYVEPGDDASVTLKLEPPANVEPGTYRCVVQARGEGVVAELPLELTVEEKLPPSLALEVELPTLKGKPNSTFRYSATLKNEGDENLPVNLMYSAPPGFLVTFKLSGQEVTSLPLEPNQSKRLSIEARPFLDLPAGEYPITVRAQGDEAEATLELTAEVTGESNLTVTAPDGRLSGRAYAGDETPLKIIVRNTGSAPARAVELSSSEPSGWSVELEPKEIGEIGAGEQVEVTAKIRPADKAIAGDYMVTVRARPEGSASKSAEFRITVLTSTLWGVVGVALIAVAVGVVGIAVLRFGRR
ncbi:MAG: NEW3 domain-containing protein [Anaerolineae bacterium]